MSFICEICKKEFHNKSNLNRHIVGTKKCQKIKENQTTLEINQLKEQKDLEINKLKEQQDREIQKLLEDKYRELGERDKRIYDLEREVDKLHIYKELTESAMKAPKNSTVNNLIVTPDMVPIHKYKVPPNSKIGRHIDNRNMGKVLSTLMEFNDTNKDNWSIRTRDLSRGVGMFVNDKGEWVTAKHNEIGLTLQPKLYVISSNYKEDIDEDQDTCQKIEKYESVFWFNKMINDAELVQKHVLKNTPNLKLNN